MSRSASLVKQKESLGCVKLKVHSGLNVEEPESLGTSTA